MKRRIATLMAGLFMLSALGVGAASAAVPTPGEAIPGNYQCPAGALKVDPVESGTYNLPDGGTITITTRNTSKGWVFDFTTSDAEIDSIVVKGGPNYNVYIFAPAVTSAEGLHSPLNPNNNKWYGLSHLCIEGTKKDDKK
jgi:hypothetical protein